jgi:glycosyltransferase involved in cell wall biosynthesis
MKILYDYQGFNQIIGGVSRYSLELIKSNSMDVQIDLPKIFTDNIYYKDLGLPYYSFLNNNQNRLKNNIYKSFNILQSIKTLSLSKYDIFHPLFYNPYYINFVKSPVVVTIHDMNHFKFPFLTQKSKIVQSKIKLICETANSIIAISNETKSDLIHFLNISENKINVINLGIDPTYISFDEKKIYNFPYLLYIGNREGYKNFNTFLEAFSFLNSDINLVCTGSEFNISELNLINKLSLNSRVIQKFVSDFDLNNLLCNAIAYVNPSLGEGFGLPILEAFKYNCPCIISDLKCFHEVAGDAARFFNPLDIDDIIFVLNNTIYNQNVLSNMKNQGQIQLKKFSWKQTVENTKKVYESLL